MSLMLDKYMTLVSIPYRPFLISVQPTQPAIQHDYLADVDADALRLRVAVLHVC